MPIQPPTHFINVEAAAKFLGNINQKEMAEAIGYAREHVNRVLNGHNPAGRDMIDKICGFAGCRPSDIIDVSKPIEPIIIVKGKSSSLYRVNPLDLLNEESRRKLAILFSEAIYQELCKLEIWTCEKPKVLFSSIIYLIPVLSSSVDLLAKAITERKITSFILDKEMTVSFEYFEQHQMGERLNNNPPDGISEYLVGSTDDIRDFMPHLPEEDRIASDSDANIPPGGLPASENKKSTQDKDIP